MNIIFPEYEEFHTKLVFYRIPKNAGTSICEHLTYANLLNFHKRDLREKSKHPTYLKPDEFKDILIGENLRNYFSFCVVRNPWERVISVYCSNKSENQSFEDFLESGKNQYFGMGKQIDWTVGKYPPKKILRFESLQQDFSEMVENHGLITVDPNLPHRNKTEHDHYSVYYNDTTRKIVSELFKEDIEAFDYIFEDKPNKKTERGSVRI